MNDFAFFRMDRTDLALERRGNLHGRLVGHDLAQGLVVVHVVADFDLPLHHFAFMNAFA